MMLIMCAIAEKLAMQTYVWDVIMQLMARLIVILLTKIGFWCITHCNVILVLIRFRHLMWKRQLDLPWVSEL